MFDILELFEGRTIEPFDLDEMEATVKELHEEDLQIIATWKRFTAKLTIQTWPRPWRPTHDEDPRTTKKAFLLSCCPQRPKNDQCDFENCKVKQTGILLKP